MKKAKLFFLPAKQLHISVIRVMHCSGQWLNKPLVYQGFLIDKRSPVIVLANAEIQAQIVING